MFLVCKGSILSVTVTVTVHMFMSLQPARICYGASTVQFALCPFCVMPADHTVMWDTAVYLQTVLQYIFPSNSTVPPACLPLILLPDIDFLITDVINAEELNYYLTLILWRSHTGTVWFYTSTSNKRAAWPKLYTKSLTRDLKLMYSHFTLVRISIKL